MPAPAPSIRLATLAAALSCGVVAAASSDAAWSEPERATTLTAFVQARVRGDEAAAREIGLAALAAALPAGASERESAQANANSTALARVVLGLEGGPAGLLARVGEGAPAAALIRAAALAATGSCTDAMELLQRPAAVAASAQAGGALLAADAFAACDQMAEALAVLHRVGPSDPRIQLAAGQLLLRLGDDDSAALWCERASGAPSVVPAIALEAAECAAAANAARGVLPRAGRAFLAARRATAADTSLPAVTRADALLSVAWLSLAPDSPGGGSIADARVALAAASRLEAGTERRLIAQAMTAYAAALADDVAAARTALSAWSGLLALPPRVAVLRWLVQARIGAALGDPVVADTALSEAAAAAKDSKSAGLIGAVAVLRARTARDENNWQALQSAVEEGFIAMANARKNLASPFYDPSLQRRALDLVFEVDFRRGQLLRNRATELLEAAERLRLARQGVKADTQDVPDLATVQRFLASRNSGLLAFAIGERHTYVWSVKTGEIEVRTLPAGDELFDIAGPLAQGVDPGGPAADRTVGLHGGLAHHFARGSELLIQTDGFLTGIPWGALPAPPDVQHAGTRLEDAFTVVLTPSLQALTAPVAIHTSEIRNEESFVALVEPETLPPGARQLGLQRFDAYRLVPAAGEARDAVLGAVLDGQTILHVGLPLLAVGRNAGSVVWTLPASRGMGETFTLREVVQRDLDHRTDLVVISATGGWSIAPASLVRAASWAVESGARSALVALGPLADKRGGALWSKIYSRLDAGMTNAEALADLRNDVDRPRRAERVPVELVGNPGARLIKTRRVAWPFWLTLGGAVAIVGVALFRLLRPRHDPFEIEPPEEA